MAVDTTFRGDAPEVAQVNTVTPASVTVGNVFTLTINGKAVTYTAAAATVADVTAGLVAAVLAAQSTVTEFNDVTPTDNSTNLTLTASTPGVPFTQTSSAATGTGTPGCTLSTSTTTASSGPEDWGVAANWTSGTVPANGDTVRLTRSDVSIKYSLDQHTVQLAALYHDASFTGDVALPDYNQTGGYYEYRPKKLSIGATKAEIGRGDGPGSNRMWIDFGSGAVDLTVYKTGSSQDTGVPALQVEGANASNVLQAFAGQLGVGLPAGTSTNFPTVRLGFANSQSSDVTATFGDGCLLTNVYQSGGTTVFNCSLTLLDLRAGTATFQKAAAAPTINLPAGTVVWNSSGSIGSVKNMTSKSTLDFSRDRRPRTVTGTVTVGPGGTVKDPNSTVTWPAEPLGLLAQDMASSNIDLGKNVILTPTPV